MSEEEFEEFNVKKLMEIGIKYEKNLQRIYDNLMESDLPTTQRKGSKRLKGQEKDHEDSLKHIYEKRFSKSDLKDLESKVNTNLIDPEENETGENVKKAIELERKAEECYQTIANKLEDGSDQKNIKYIAFMEKNHQNMLKNKFPH